MCAQPPLQSELFKPLSLISLPFKQDQHTTQGLVQIESTTGTQNYIARPGRVADVAVQPRIRQIPFRHRWDLRFPLPLPHCCTNSRGAKLSRFIPWELRWLASPSHDFKTFYNASNHCVQSHSYAVFQCISMCLSHHMPSLCPILFIWLE